tara:strand:- start:2769 stop:3386 length:618 start_codon:yes stop_codon:yes gene_type:complete
MELLVFMLATTKNRPHSPANKLASQKFERIEYSSKKMGRTMKQTETEVPSILPLLFRAATPRSAGPEIPGNYDPNLNVWVVNTAGVSRPIITISEGALLCVRTLTKIAAETDDEEALTELSAQQLCELQTKTETKQESDDEQAGSLSRFGSIAELETKTSFNSEADDDKFEELNTINFTPSYTLPELLTKTDVQRESDDDLGFEM